MADGMSKTRVVMRDHGTDNNDNNDYNNTANNNNNDNNNEKTVVMRDHIVMSLLSLSL